MNKKKVRLNKNGKILVTIIGVLLILFLLSFFANFKLKSLNYSNKFIKMAKKEDITSKVKDTNKYSKVLEQMLLTGNYNDKYFDIYFDINYSDNDDMESTLNSLLDLGYDATNVNDIYSSLDKDEVKTLTTFEYSKDISNFLQYDFFVLDNLNRYQSYKDISAKDYKDTVVYVNIGLDNDFYTNVNKALNVDDVLVLVNKYHELDSTYVPSDLVDLPTTCAYADKQVKSVVYDDYAALCEAVNEKGGKLVGYSAYRSYDYQKGLYNNYVSQDGKEKADTYSARAGFSEHQTGLAIDVSIDNFTGSSIVNSPVYDWFFENIHEYGFIIRYEKEKTDITGYTYEPWHIRYVGKEIASFIKNNNITFDEYYAIYKTK